MAANEDIDISIKNKTHRQVWGQAETNDLIQIWREYYVRLEDTVVKMPILEEMAARMYAMGHQRTPTQVQKKLQNLKGYFRKEHSTGVTSAWVHYRMVEEVLKQKADGIPGQYEFSRPIINNTSHGYTLHTAPGPQMGHPIAPEAQHHDDQNGMLKYDSDREMCQREATYQQPPPPPSPMIDNTDKWPCLHCRKKWEENIDNRLLQIQEQTLEFIADMQRLQQEMTRELIKVQKQTLSQMTALTSSVAQLTSCIIQQSGAPPQHTHHLVATLAPPTTADNATDTQPYEMYKNEEQPH